MRSSQSRHQLQTRRGRRSNIRLTYQAKRHQVAHCPSMSLRCDHKGTETTLVCLECLSSIRRSNRVRAVRPLKTRGNVDASHCGTGIHLHFLLVMEQTLKLQRSIPSHSQARMECSSERETERKHVPRCVVGIVKAVSRRWWTAFSREISPSAWTNSARPRTSSTSRGITRKPSGEWPSNKRMETCGRNDPPPVAPGGR